MLFVLLASLFIPLVLLAPSANSAVNRRPTRHVVDTGHNVVSAPTRVLEADARSVGLNVTQLRAKWQHVAVCEVAGNWSMAGPRYSGIGFLNTTWHEYGGDRYAFFAGEATEAEQIIVGMEVTKGWIPDQSGCSPGGW
jgi:hypothetical protein